MTEKIKIKVRVKVKGTKIVHSFFKKYSMEEHFNKKYVLDGHGYAMRQLKVQPNDVLVSDIPIIKKIVFDNIKSMYPGADNYYCNVYNPMLNNFSSYRLLTIGVHKVFVKTMKNMIIFSVKNDDWLKEFNTKKPAN